MLERIETQAPEHPSKRETYVLTGAMTVGDRESSVKETWVATAGALQASFTLRHAEIPKRMQLKIRRAESAPPEP